MKPGVVTWNPLIKAALASGLAPAPIMEVFWGLGLARSVIAGARLGVFEALAGGPKGAGELAEVLGCDPEALTALLNALNGFGYLKRGASGYTLSRKAARWLPPDAAGSNHHAMHMLGDLFALIEPMEALIRGGEVENFHHRPLPEETWRSYLRGLGASARLIGPPLARLVRTDRPPERALDVAGGHGMYAAALCKRWPGLRCEVLDLPQAAAVGREMVEEEGLSDRVTFREGDLREAEWGEGYDLVLLFNILHNLEGPECAEAVRKARAALRPGGTLAIADSEHAGEEGNLSAVAGFNELFFFLLSGSRAWPEPDIRGWLTEAGFEQVKRGTTLALPGLILLTARAGG